MLSNTSDEELDSEGSERGGGGRLIFSSSFPQDIRQPDCNAAIAGPLGSQGANLGIPEGALGCAFALCVRFALARTARCDAAA